MGRALDGDRHRTGQRAHTHRAGGTPDGISRGEPVLPVGGQDRCDIPPLGGNSGDRTGGVRRSGDPRGRRPGSGTHVRPHRTLPTGCGFGRAAHRPRRPFDLRLPQPHVRRRLVVRAVGRPPGARRSGRPRRDGTESRSGTCRAGAGASAAFELPRMGEPRAAAGATGDEPSPRHGKQAGRTGPVPDPGSGDDGARPHRRRPHGFRRLHPDESPTEGPHPLAQRALQGRLPHLGTDGRHPSGP